MNKKLKKIIPAFLSVAMLAGTTSALQISAIPGGYEGYFNEDGSYNTDIMQKAIEKSNSLLCPEGFTFTTVIDVEDFINEGIEYDDSMSYLEAMESVPSKTGIKLYTLKNYHKTECIDGQNYIIADGKKYKYSIDDKSEEEGKIYLTKEVICIYSPATLNGLDFTSEDILAPDTQQLPKYRFTLLNEDGSVDSVINPTGLSYTEMFDLGYEFYNLQKDAFMDMYDSSLYLRWCKGIYGDDIAYDDVPMEEFIKDQLDSFIRSDYNYELDEYLNSDLNEDGTVDEKDKNMLRNYTHLKRGDVNGDGLVDINDLQMVKQYLLGTKKLTPGEEVATSTTNNFKPDIRDVVALKQYIVKLIDNFD